MKFHSLRLKSVRLHQDTTLEFAPDLTVISGPNESGKSTVLEALYNALFLRARGTSRHHRGMKSNLHPEHPEVELEFSCGSGRYTLKKKFSGNNGTALLRQKNGGSWNGDEAENELARLLATADGMPWAHFFVRQRQSASEPEEHQAATHLFQRLQKLGGGAVMESADDTRVALTFEQMANAVYTQNHEPRTNSDLARALSEETDAAKTLQGAQSAFDVLIGAQKRFLEAQEIVKRNSENISQFTPKKAETEQKLQEVQALESRSSLQQLEAQQGGAEHEAFLRTEQQIAELRKRIAQLTEELQPAQNLEHQLQTDLAKLRAGAFQCEQTHSQASAGERAAQKRNNLAGAWLRKWECQQQMEMLTRSLERVREMRTNLEKLRNNAASLPEIKESHLHKLRALDAEVRTNEAAYRAIGAKLTVLKADLQVSADGLELADGQELVLTKTTQIQIGQGVQLLLSPGGGTSLNVAAELAEKAKNAFEKKLKQLGVASLQQAENVERSLSSLAVEIRALEKNLPEEAVENTQEQYNSVSKTLAQAEELINDLREIALQAPSSLQEAQQLYENESAALLVAEKARRQSELDLASAQKKVAGKEQQIQELAGSLQQKRSALSDCENLHTGLLAQHGTDAEREERRVGLAKKAAQSQAALELTLEALKNLQPDQLREDKERYTRQLENWAKELRQAELDKATSQALLQRDGSIDVEAELERAKIRLEDASARRNVLQTRAEALKRLHKLFQDQRQQLVQLYLEPFNQKVSFYLKYIFGPSAQTSIGEQISLDSILLNRDGYGSFGFEVLSGGTAEQVAAAVRLAMAEVLAGDHDGTLPVLFDDAFTNSDSQRVAKIHGMLYRAAQQGLQIIVLSCDPASYNGLGASSQTLTFDPNASRPAAQPAVSDESVAAADPEQANAFLKALEALGGAAANPKLREALGWDEALYERVKSTLIANGQLRHGRGKSICLSE